MLTEAQCKRLTLFLGECWHEDQSSIYHPCCCSCGKEYGEDIYRCFTDHLELSNRTFTTQADMMDLYKKLHEVGKWGEFISDTYFKWEGGQMLLPAEGDFIAWLFCLSGEGYEERCGMVDEFLEGGK